MASIKPLGDRVLLKVLDQESKTSSGLYIPDTAQEKTQKAEVIEIGPGGTDKDGKRLTIDVKKGDIVIYDKFAGVKIKDGNNEYLIVSNNEIVAVIA
ncbi:MAG: co-chaperone GroES [Spirochaetes bacterium]|nr:co-chaperone GroES [Spirochaetota bacterium]